MGPRRRSTQRSIGWGVGALSAVALLVAATGAGASKATTPPNSGSGRVTVPAEVSNAVASGTDVGPTDPNMPIQLSFILNMRNLGQLEHQVELGWSGHYLTTAQFAATYGQPASMVQAIESYLARYGIQTSAYADNLDISAYGTVGEFSQALVVKLRNFQVREPNSNGFGTHQATVYAPGNGPTLPGAIGNAVLTILGLSNYSAEVSNVRMPPKTVHTAADEPAAGSLPPSAFSDRYGLTPLVNQGARGQGRTIGIITFGPFDPANAYTFWNDVLGLGVPHGRISVTAIDGGATNYNATVETDLDVEQAGAIAPGAHLHVYESGPGDMGFLDPFFAAASDNDADAVTISFGNSETLSKLLQDLGYEPASYTSVIDEAYLEMAAQGQTAFSAAGDTGPYQAQNDVQTTNLDVNVPTDSPYVTAAGGTTLPGTYGFQAFDPSVGHFAGPVYTAAIPSERAWSSDYEWPLYPVFGFSSEQAAALNFDFGFESGGGGGFSTLEHRPLYQTGAIGYQARQYLSPTNNQLIIPGVVLPTGFSFNPAPALVQGGSVSGRAIPDISANADTASGYEVYDAEVFGGLVTNVGGTSVVAPQLAAAAAVIDNARGGRTGFWNPPLYAAASNPFRSPMTPLNDTTVYSGINYLYAVDANGHRTALPGQFSNNNLYYTGSPLATWNPASGLGTPNLAKIAQVVGPR